MSYAAAATKHKVSDYQFFSPKEWFAEAYAAFYDPKYPDPTKDNELKRHDPATNDFFLKHVHLHTHAPRPDDPVG